MAAPNDFTSMTFARDPTSAEIANFIATRTGAEMIELVRSINEPSAQGTFACALLDTPPAAPTEKKADKSKKALNAFVGFRCYYILIPQLKEWPMKKLSHVLATLWDSDPNKSLWSLLTKTWSIMRDQIGKNKVPLDKFFRIVCPAVKLPSPQVYLERGGYRLTLDKNGEPAIDSNITPTPEALSTGATNSTLSVHDIVTLCHHMGYAQEFVPDASITPSTFHVQLSPPYKTTTEVVEAMYAQREINRNKRRTRRQQLRDRALASETQEQIVDVNGGQSSSFQGIPDMQMDTDMSEHFDFPPAQSTSFEGSALGSDFMSEEDLNLQQYLLSSLSTSMGATLNDTSSFSPSMGLIANNTGALPNNDSAMVAGNTTGYTAFRRGADEDATLPPYDSSTF